MSVGMRRVGLSGLLVSEVGLGCNNFGRPGTATESLDGTRAVLDAAIEHGVVFLDTAEMYGGQGRSEALMGEALAGRRDRVVVATKFGHSGVDMGHGPTAGAKASRAYIRRAIDASLSRLRTDWIDLYQLHTPDPGTPIAETVDALDDLVREGKIRYYGHSNLSGWQIAEAALTASGGVGSAARARPGFVSSQNQFSLLERDAEREVLPAARHFGLGFFPYFPLYNGLLTGKFTREGGPQDSRIMSQRRHLWENAPWDALESYQAFCDERGITMLEATFGWLLSQEGVASVIAGATSPAQVAANAAAGAAWRPTGDELAAIDAIFPGPGSSEG